MTISIDANVIVALWWKDDTTNRAAASLLNQARAQGQLVVCAPVYAELLGDPRRDTSELNAFLDSGGIAVE